MMMIYDEILQELVHEEQMMAAEDERQLELERQAEEAQFAVRPLKSAAPLILPRVLLVLPRLRDAKRLSTACGLCVAVHRPAYPTPADGGGGGCLLPNMLQVRGVLWLNAGARPLAEALVCVSARAASPLPPPPFCIPTAAPPRRPHSRDRASPLALSPGEGERERRRGRGRRGGEGGRRQRGRRGRECLRECGLPQAGGHDVVLASCAAGLHHTTTARARVQEIPVLGRCQHLLCLRWLPPFNPGTPLNVLPLLAYDKKKSEFCIFFWRPHGLYRAPG